MALDPTPAILQRLAARGRTDTELGRVFGVNSSLISQVRRGLKPGRNLQASAAALEALPDGPVPSGAVPARTTRKQAVRKGLAGGARWQTVDVKRQGMRSGGSRITRLIESARDAGQRFALDVTVPASAKVEDSGKGHPLRDRNGKRSRDKVITIGEGTGLDPTTWLGYIARQGGDVAQAIASYLVETGRAESLSREQILGVQFRSWSV